MPLSITTAPWKAEAQTSRVFDHRAVWLWILLAIFTMRGCCQTLPGYRLTGFFFFYSQSSNAATVTSQCHEGVPRHLQSHLIKWHHIKGASPPTISHDGRCSFPGFKRIVDKQRMGETTDQHAGSQSNGRQSSNNLRRAWAPPLEARPRDMAT